MAETLSYMNYHSHDFVIVSTIDFELIQDKLFEAGLIDQEEIARVLKSSNLKIKQNICLLKILFEGKRDFNPFIEILRSDTNAHKHGKLAKQISAPVMLTMEEKQHFSIRGQKTFDQLASTCNESNEFITELFRDLSFVPKCNESPENKYDNESGIYSEAELSPDSESISEEEYNLLSESDPESCEFDDKKILSTSNEIEQLNTTLPGNSNANPIVCSGRNWKMIISKRMRKFGFKILFPSVIMIGFIFTHIIIHQPTAWLLSLFKIVI